MTALLVLALGAAAALVGYSGGRGLRSMLPPPRCSAEGYSAGAFINTDRCPARVDPVCMGRLCRKHCLALCGERCGHSTKAKG
jgi:hypothetical protein